MALKEPMRTSLRTLFGVGVVLSFSTACWDAAPLDSEPSGETYEVTEGGSHNSFGDELVSSGESAVESSGPSETSSEDDEGENDDDCDADEDETRSDWWLERYDGAGQVIWTRNFKSPDTLASVETTKTGEILVAGSFDHVDEILIFDDTGKIAARGSHLLTGTLSQRFNAVAKRPDGSIITLGNAVFFPSPESLDDGYPAAPVLDYFSETLEWIRAEAIYPPQPQGAQAVLQIVVQSTGGYYLLGANCSDACPLWLQRRDAMGTLQWERKWTGQSHANSMALRSDNSVILARDTYPSPNETGAELLRMGIDGEIIWKREFPDDNFMRITLVDADRIAIYHSSNQEAKLTLLNESGAESIWSVDMDGYIRGIAATSDGGVLLARPNAQGVSTLRKMDSQGSIVWEVERQPGFQVQEMTTTDIAALPDGGALTIGLARVLPEDDEDDEDDEEYQCPSGMKHPDEIKTIFNAHHVLGQDRSTELANPRQQTCIRLKGDHELVFQIGFGPSNGFNLQSRVGIRLTLPEGIEGTWDLTDPALVKPDPNYPGSNPSIEVALHYSSQSPATYVFDTRHHASVEGTLTVALNPEKTGAVIRIKGIIAGMERGWTFDQEFEFALPVVDDTGSRLPTFR